MLQTTVYLDTVNTCHNNTTTNAVPEGYMTLEDFRTEAKASLTKILNRNGIY